MHLRSWQFSGARRCLDRHPNHTTSEQIHIYFESTFLFVMLWLVQILDRPNFLNISVKKCAMLFSYSAPTAVMVLSTITKRRGCLVRHCRVCPWRRDVWNYNTRRQAVACVTMESACQSPPWDQYRSVSWWLWFHGGLYFQNPTAYMFMKITDSISMIKIAAHLFSYINFLTIWVFPIRWYIDGLAQDCGNSSPLFVQYRHFRNICLFDFHNGSGIFSYLQFTSKSLLLIP